MNRLGALDALTRIEMQQLIERLWAEHGFTALLVTHDVGEAVALADRVVLIEEQRIAFDEPVGLARPPLARRARFLPPSRTACCGVCCSSPKVPTAPAPDPLLTGWQFAV